MRPRHDGRGNGSLRWRQRQLLRASMRPRHDGRGNLRSGGSSTSRRAGFNEAAPRWARKYVGVGTGRATNIGLQ